MQIVLDQPLVMGVHVPWDSQLEYYMCHNDWDEVLKLLDLIPEDLYMMEVYKLLWMVPSSRLDKIIQFLPIASI